MPISHVIYDEIDKIKEISRSEKTLLSRICLYDSNQNGCFASNQHFAGWLGLTKDSIVKMLTKLRKLGLIYDYFENGYRRIKSNLKEFFDRESKKPLFTTEELSTKNDHLSTEKTEKIPTPDGKFSVCTIYRGEREDKKILTRGAVDKMAMPLAEQPHLGNENIFIHEDFSPPETSPSESHIVAASHESRFSCSKAEEATAISELQEQFPAEFDAIDALSECISWMQLKKTLDDCKRAWSLEDRYSKKMRNEFAYYVTALKNYVNNCKNSHNRVVISILDHLKQSSLERQFERESEEREQNGRLSGLIKTRR